jgi:hypothetical protein
VAWSGAAGPVSGYSVYVQRDNADYKHEADVAQPRATVFGAPGSSARVIVVAFDRVQGHGPSSPSSARFTFPAASANSAAAGQTGVGTVASIAPASAQPASPSVAMAAAAPAAAAATSDVTPAHPFTGGALVWQAGDAFRLTDSAIETKRLFTRPSNGAQLVGVADFDGDGQRDLLWTTSGSLLGYMAGSALRGSDPVALVDLGPLAAGEQAIGAGDFDGDGYGDVLAADGYAIRARFTVPGGAPALVDLGRAAQASLAGIGDFDANGSDDIAWRTAGGLAIWLMDRGRITATVELAVAQDVLGVGDWDGDGAAELALRNADGTVSVLHPLDAAPQLEATDLADTGVWQGAGALDLERDGSDELVLATAGAIRFAGLPGDQMVALDPQSPWQLVALLP